MVGTAEPEGPVEGVKALNPSGTGYYFSCGESPWEGEGGETKPNLEEDLELRITTKTFYQVSWSLGKGRSQRSKS